MKSHVRADGNPTSCIASDVDEKMGFWAMAGGKAVLLFLDEGLIDGISRAGSGNSSGETGVAERQGSCPIRRVGRIPVTASSVGTRRKSLLDDIIAAGHSIWALMVLPSIKLPDMYPTLPMIRTKQTASPHLS